MGLGVFILVVGCLVKTVARLFAEIVFRESAQSIFQTRDIWGKFKPGLYKRIRELLGFVFVRCAFQMASACMRSLRVCEINQTKRLRFGGSGEDSP